MWVSSLRRDIAWYNGSFEAVRQAGIVLRPADGIAPCKDNSDRYERIGWLSYCVLQQKKHWKPAGMRTKFLIV
jgi:hypothetical protein